MEVTFTLKTGTEVAERFNGLEIPYTVADNLAHARELAGSDENVVHLFNRAFALDLQKDVKSIANAEATDADMLRKRARDYKPGDLRPRYLRDPNAPSSKSSGVVKEAKAKATLLDEIVADLAALPPELRAKYEARAAALNVKLGGSNGAPAESTPAPAATGSGRPAARGSGKPAGK